MKRTKLIAKNLILVGIIAMSLIGLSGLRYANAQESLRIAAVVNENAISAFDLFSRIRLIIILSRLPETNDTVNQIKANTLRMLIDENLKLQEAEKLEISATEEDITNAVTMIEQRNKIKPGQLLQMLRSNNVNTESLLQQIRTDIVWPQTVMAKYASTVSISESALDAAVAKADAAREKPVYLLSEIIIPVESITQNQQVKNQMEMLSKDLQNGANFAALARSFSQSPSAPIGGDIGWLRLDQLPPEISPTVTALKVGQISTPIPLKTGYIIIKLRDYKENTKKQVASPILNLSQVHLELPVGTPEATVAVYMESARKNTSGTTDCESFIKAGSKISSPLSGNLGEIEQSRLPAHLSAAVSKLDIGVPSEPIRTSDGVIILMVCERKIPVTEDDSAARRENIYLQLLNERMAIYARQFLREIRRTAFIDIRM